MGCEDLIPILFTRGQDESIFPEAITTLPENGTIAGPDAGRSTLVVCDLMCELYKRSQINVPFVFFNSLIVEILHFIAQRFGTESTVVLLTDHAECGLWLKAATRAQRDGENNAKVQKTRSKKKKTDGGAIAPEEEGVPLVPYAENSLFTDEGVLIDGMHQDLKIDRFLQTGDRVTRAKFICYLAQKLQAMNLDVRMPRRVLAHLEGSSVIELVRKRGDTPPLGGCVPTALSTASAVHAVSAFWHENCKSPICAQAEGDTAMTMWAEYFLEAPPRMPQFTHFVAMSYDSDTVPLVCHMLWSRVLSEEASRDSDAGKQRIPLAVTWDRLGRPSPGRPNKFPDRELINLRRVILKSAYHGLSAESFLALCIQNGTDFCKVPTPRASSLVSDGFYVHSTKEMNWKEAFRRDAKYNRDLYKRIASAYSTSLDGSSVSQALYFAHRTREQISPRCAFLLNMAYWMRRRVPSMPWHAVVEAARTEREVPPVQCGHDPTHTFEPGWCLVCQEWLTLHGAAPCPPSSVCTRAPPAAALSGVSVAITDDLQVQVFTICTASSAPDDSKEEAARSLLQIHAASSSSHADADFFDLTRYEEESNVAAGLSPSATREKRARASVLLDEDERVRSATPPKRARDSPSPS